MTTRNQKSDETEQKQLSSIKPLFWISSSKKDLKSFPDDVKKVFGTSLHYAQRGGKANNAKPLKGFKGSGVLEIVDDFQTDTYRCVYTVKMKEAVYVLHSFQKKSKKGISTPYKEMDLVKSRLKEAQKHYEEWIQSRNKGEKHIDEKI